jgi:hypothetical protein
MMTLQMNCENSYDSVYHYDCFHGIELKERMEHDLDDVSRVAQGLKVKVEALDRAVRSPTCLCVTWQPSKIF